MQYPARFWQFISHERHINRHPALLGIALASLAVLIIAIWSGLGVAGWTVLAAAASALGTLVIAVLTWRTVEVNRAMVEANRQMVMTSRDMLAANRAQVDANREMVEEMREGRLVQQRPLILLSFRYDGGNLNLHVDNYGGAASNVRFAFEPALISSDGIDVGRRPPLSTGVPLMPPGDRTTVEFDLYRNYIDLDFYLKNRPSCFVATVAYDDPFTGDAYPPVHLVLDLRHLAPTEQAELQVFDIETERAKRWRAGASPSERDLAEFAETARFVRSHTFDRRHVDWNNPADLGLQLQLRGWELDHHQYFDGHLVAATKMWGRGPHAGHKIAIDGWDFTVALTRLLQLAIRTDADQDGSNLGCQPDENAP